MIVSLKGVLRFAQSDAEWWKDPRPMREIAAALDRFDLRAGMKLAGKPTGTLRSKKDLGAWSKTWKPGDWYVLAAEKNGSPGRTELQLIAWPGALKLQLTLGPSDADPRRKTLLETLAGFTRDLHERLRCGLFHFVVDLESDYRRPGPPRDAGDWWVGVVSMVVDPKMDVAGAYDREQAAREVERVLHAPLPKGAARSKLGDLVEIRFVPDLTDEGAVDRARASQDRWITSLVGSEVSPFWNEQGDEMIVLIAAEKRPPLTLYDASTRHGFKAMFEAKDAEIAKLERWLRAKELPDGTPIDGISIVFTTRKGALAAAKRVSKRGLCVLYTDKTGTFWDPFPSGIER